MSETFNASDMTSGAVKAIHAGVNVAITSYTLNETASGNYTINMHRLPPGARVVDCKYLSQTTVAGTGAETIFVSDHLGNNYIRTGSIGQALDGNGTGLGTRITSSTHMQVVIQGVGTGTVSQDVTLITQYLADLEGD